MTSDTFLSDGSSLNCLTSPKSASGGAAGTLEDENTDAVGADMMCEDREDSRCAGEEEVGGDAEEEGEGMINMQSRKKQRI